MQSLKIMWNKIERGLIEMMLPYLCIQKRRWLVRNHPDSAVRVMALKQSGAMVGEDVFISIGMTILGYKPITIGDRCAFGDSVSLVTESSPNLSRLTQVDSVKTMMKSGAIEIGNDVWVGSKVVILPGIKIGKMSVIGAGSIVTKSIPHNSVAYGVPARVEANVW